MPLDPTISLDVAGGSKPSFPGVGDAAYNPLGLIGNIADTQSKINQLKLFNQTFQARQKAGQIMATAPDIASGAKLMAADPDVSAFAPELATQAAATNNALTAAQGAVQGQGFDAFTNTVKMLPSVLQDPGQWPALVNSTLALTSPAARPGVANSLSYLQQALTSPMPDGSPVTQGEQQKRIAGWTIAGGMGDAIPRILGTPAAPAIGGATVPGIIAPAQGGPGQQPPGSFTPAGGNGPSATNAPGGQSGGFQLSDGTPLQIGSSPHIGTGVLGQTALSPAQAEAATDRMKDWSGPELRTFQNAQLNQGYLAQMGADFDQMTKSGGMQVPGAGASFRTSFTNAINTLYQGLDEKPPFDPTTQAAAENMVKNTRTMGITLLTTLLGNQREAAQTIHNIQQSVPSIDNSYLGGKLLIDTIGAANQRQIDRRNFENAWQAKNQGNLQGADESFNAQAPMTDYTNKVLDKYGLSPEGFKDLGSLENAARLGYLTPAQAAAEAKRQGFKLPSGGN